MSDYLAAYPFYSQNDRWFRYLRDIVLGPKAYQDTMMRMLKRHNYEISTATSRLWMSERQVLSLHAQGHVIGMHSFSHPTAMSQLTRAEQKKEYFRNKRTSMPDPWSRPHQRNVSSVWKLQPGYAFHTERNESRNRLQFKYGKCPRQRPP